MTLKNKPQALILLAHGSRDAAWRAPFEAIATQMRAQIAAQQSGLASGLPVRCAYLQLCQPDLHQAVADLHAAGCQDIAIAPLFLGAGTHIRQDLPDLLAAVQAQQADCTLTLLPVFGDDAAVQSWMASWLLQGWAALQG
jgi:sirohydrochlorin cobaltochelatase